MIRILNGKDISLKDTASFIAKLNQQEVHHIGFCGTNPEEIQNAIKEDVSEMTGAVEDGKLIGWIGADIDKDTAEVWGPFVGVEYKSEVAFDMWRNLLDKIPASVNNFDLFSNKENKFVKKFAERLQFEQATDQAVLIFQKENVEKLPKTDLKELTQTDHMAFIRLHDEAFPGTYYSGQEIIERINQTQKVFILKDGDRLAGYAYVEAQPAYGEGSIEFIAVDPVFQGKRYGQKLLSEALHWLFSFDAIGEIQLAVAADNQIALKLYLSVGFKVKHELYYFEKQRDNSLV
ncbi:GNAT family N-acetyltransferase [Virgibacillus oceani]